MTVLGLGSSVTEAQGTPQFSVYFGIFETKEIAQSRADDFGILGDNAPNLTFQNDYYLTNSNSPASFAFFLLHDCPDDRAYEFVLLVDNRQLAFEMEYEEATDLSHSIIVETGIPLVRGFTISDLEDGMHNISLIAVPEKDECFEEDLPPDIPPANPRNLIVTNSKSVLVGIEQPTEFTVSRPNQENFKVGITKEDSPVQGARIGFSPEPDRLTVQLPPPGVDLSPGESFDFYIYGRNDGYDQIEEWSIVMFVAQMQVPIDPFAIPVNWHESLKLLPGQEIALPATIVAPELPGNYRLLVIMFGEPYRLTTLETLFMPAEFPMKRFELRVKESD